MDECDQCFNGALGLHEGDHIAYGPPVCSMTSGVRGQLLVYKSLWTGSGPHGRLDNHQSSQVQDQLKDTNIKVSVGVFNQVRNLWLKGFSRGC